MIWLDIAPLGTYIFFSIYAGLRSRKVASENLEEYFLAGRTLKGWQAGISMAATQFAADTPLLVTGLIASQGIFSLWRLWIYAIAFLMMGFLLAPSWRRANVLTDAELTELRYGSRAAGLLRAFKAVYLGSIFNCTVLAMVMLAATRILEPFWTWNIWLPVSVYQPVLEIIMAAGIELSASGLDSSAVWILTTNNVISLALLILITSFYSTVGGLRSVVLTDIFQFGIAIFSTSMFTYFVVNAAGGLGNIHDQIMVLFGHQEEAAFGITGEEILAFTPSRAKDASFPFLGIVALQWLLQLNSDGTGYLAQRSMACRSDHDAKVAAVLFTVLQLVVRSLLWIVIGLGLLVIFPPQPGDALSINVMEREFTYVRGISELLPAGARGLMLVGMLAAMASTLDTHLSWGAGYWSNDIYKRFICQSWLKREPSARALVWVARGANILTICLSILILPFLTSVQEAWKASLLLGAGMGTVLVLRWVWWRINAWGELACIAFSMLMAPLLLWTSPYGEASRLLLMGIGSTVVGIVVSLITGPEDPIKLRRFYEVARPPGFWGPISKQVDTKPDEDVKRFWNGVGSTLLASISLFCLLTGIGSYLVGSPPPAWLPWDSSTWALVVFAGGCALVPFWIRLGFFR